MTDRTAALEAALQEAARRHRLLERDLADLVAAGSEPIAIVGAACRFPGGVTGLDSLWAVLAAGRDCMRPVPAERGWGDLGVEGGFVDQVAGFDAPFFGLGEGEALMMDPQQRQFLEVTWQALEDARIRPSSLAGTKTGVFAGVMPQKYGTEPVPGSAWAAKAAFGATGADISVVPGRVSYTLGLEGPAVTVDTACSSSLVALHLAAQSLRAGESSLVLAGGVTVLWTSDLYDAFEEMGGVAADFRCKAFAEGADGTSWGEGVGVVVLEKLSDAQRHGRRIRGLIRGSAVNQDGASNGLSAPNGPSQVRVIAAALAAAGAEPGDIDLIEAHGTGTALGDPIEAGALLEVFGRAPRPRPLLLGSIKSNFGHTGAAAGLAGVLKVVAAFDHEAVPPTLHAARPTTAVDWSSGAIDLATAVPTQPVPVVTAEAWEETQEISEAI
jgi:acyl transferase domain-containing protein